MLPVDTILGTLSIKEVYYDFDGPRLFSCVAATGQIYFVVNSLIEDDKEVWLYSPITQKQLGDAKKKNLSIHDLFIRSASGIVWEVKYFPQVERWMIDPIRISDIPLDYLPAPATYLETRDTELRSAAKTIDRLALTHANIQPPRLRAPLWELAPDVIALLKSSVTPVEAAATKSLRFVLDLKVEKIGARDQTEVTVQFLGNALLHVQNILDGITQSLFDSISQKTRIPQNIRERVQLVANAVYPGSFAVRLESATPELDVDPITQKAFIRFIELIDASSDERVLREMLRESGGRTVARYKALVRSIALSNTDLALDLGIPMLESSRKALFRRANAKKILPMLEEETERASEIIHVTGRLVAVSMKTRYFRIETEDQIYTGRISDECMPIVDHSEINAIYDAEMRVTIDVNTATGHETENFILIDLILAE